MRRAALALAAVLLLTGPTVLAFFSGAFFTEPRVIGALVAWAMVLLLCAIGPAPLPRTPPGWLAVIGLTALVIWSALSISWAPERGPAVENVERLLLYLGALLVAIGVCRVWWVTEIVEPALAAGITIVICYGLSGRLLPGLIHLARSSHAGGRLEQPITYWNSEGALAAVGFVLCARLAGDKVRPVAMRGLAAAAAVPLGVGVYLSYSRGAIAAAVVGLVVLVAVVPVRAQLRAALLVLAGGLIAAACSSALPGVASLEGGPGSRESDGAIMLVILLVLMAAAAFIAVRFTHGEADRDERELLGSRPRMALAGSVVALVLIGLVIGGLQEKASSADLAKGASRLTSVSSNRYEYWRVGARAFAHHPLDGLGAAGFRTYWLEHRSIRESVQAVHSIELEMAAELGLVGLLAFGTMIGGVGWAGARGVRAEPTVTAGWMAASLVWFLHASIDWDWELPAVSLPAIVLAGALIAAAERGPDLWRPSS